MAVTTFQIGDAIRYKPGAGTYGYEDAVSSDGRLAGEVIGFTPTRVRVKLHLGGARSGSTVVRCVDAASLQSTRVSA